MRSIVGYEGIYAITKEGQVHNVKRGTVLKPRPCRKGYLRVALRGKEHSVHRLVAATYLGPSELTVDHLDGDKSNNNLDNLEYVSNTVNIRRGHAVYSMIPQVRELIEEGRTDSEISDRLNISKYTVYNVRSGRRWQGM